MRLDITGAATLLVVVLAGCDPPPQASAGCGKDTDCKGDRVWEPG
jgi:hypothetical protein